MSTIYCIRIKMNDNVCLKFNEAIVLMFHLGTLELGQTCVIEAKKYQATIGQIFILKGVKILEIIQEKGWRAREPTSQGF